MKLTVKDLSGNDRGEVELTAKIIEAGRGTQAVHDVVVAAQAARRSGTACTKTMGEVAGTGKKPWRQKGTGRARAGSFASPLWRGGGVVFGPKPRDYSKKVSKATRHAALQKAFSERVKAGDILVVEDFNLAAPKTKDFIQTLKALQLEGTVLIVTDQENRNLELASRNVPDVLLAQGRSLNTYQLLLTDWLVFTRAALEQLQKRLAPRAEAAPASAQTAPSKPEERDDIV